MESAAKQKEITEADLSRIVKDVTVEIIKEHQDEIIRRAHERLRREFAPESKRD